MANTSIYNAFERMWQHVVAKLGTKAEAEHTHSVSEIGAAPAGYGLGDIISPLPASEDLNNIKYNGWYSWYADIDKKPANAPISPGTDNIDVMRVSGSGEACIQEAFDVSNSYNCGLKMQRTIYGSDSRYVSEWEWVNPPMTTGVEYRTTERYEGKHVYVKLVDFGNLPSNTYKDVNYSSVVVSAIRIEGVLKYPTEETYLNLSGTEGVASVQSILNKIRITTNTTSLVNWTAKVMVYYTKD